MYLGLLNNLMTSKISASSPKALRFSLCLMYFSKVNQVIKRREHFNFEHSLTILYLTLYCMNKRCAVMTSSLLYSSYSETIYILTIKAPSCPNINSIYPSCSVGIYEFVPASAQVCTGIELLTQSQAKIICITDFFPVF